MLAVLGGWARTANCSYCILLYIIGPNASFQIKCAKHAVGVQVVLLKHANLSWILNIKLHIILMPNQATRSKTSYCVIKILEIAYPQ